jgi:hypothetical protein
VNWRWTLVARSILASLMMAAFVVPVRVWNETSCSRKRMVLFHIIWMFSRPKQEEESDNNQVHEGLSELGGLMGCCDSMCNKR